MATVIAVPRELNSHDEVVENENFVNERMDMFKEIIKEQELSTKMNDKFLIRFLRTKKFDIADSFRLLKNYEEFKIRHATSFLQVDRSLINNVLDRGITYVVNGSDSRKSRVFWLRVGLWSLKQFSAENLLQIGAILGEAALLETSSHQALGAIAIIDMEGFSISHLKGISPGFVKKLMHYLSNCLPIRIFSAHIIRESGTFSLIFALFKKFIDDKMKKRIFFHGHDLNALSKAVEKCVLPKELGGDYEPDTSKWIELLQKPKMVKELNYLGYDITEDVK